MCRDAAGRGRRVYTWGLVSGLLHTGDTKLIKTNRKLVLLGDGVGHSIVNERFSRFDRTEFQLSRALFSTSIPIVHRLYSLCLQVYCAV